MPRLVLIDTDEAERQHIAAALTSAGFEALEASGSVEGLLLVLDSGPDIILLADEMPPLQAADLLVILRRASDAPIIVIGGGDDPEEIAALESGADSYVRVGTSLRLLTARANALLRRHSSQNCSVVSFALSPTPISLTATERRLLVCLSNHSGRPVGLEDLRVEVWGESAGIDTVKYHLRRVRRKLKTEPCGLELLCIRGVGYRLVPTRPQSTTRGGDDRLIADPRRVGGRVEVA